jgi:hypothetical protein
MLPDLKSACNGQVYCDMKEASDLSLQMPMQKFNSIGKK